MSLQDDGRSTEVRSWVGNDAIKRARTPGPTGPGFELDLLQDAARKVPNQRDGGEMYMTRDLRERWEASDSICTDLTYCWRIWDQNGRCLAFRMTAAR